MGDFTSIITPILCGILALTGAIIGSCMERKTKHTIWLLEKRVEVFAEFLKILQKCIEEASVYFRQGQKASLERGQKLLDIYFPVFNYTKVVRLFLKETSRDNFEKLVREIYAIHSEKERGDTRLSMMKEKEQALQRMLEEHIKNPKF